MGVHKMLAIGLQLARDGNGKCSQHISAVQWDYESATYIEAKNVL